MSPTRLSASVLLIASVAAVAACGGGNQTAQSNSRPNASTSTPNAQEPELPSNTPSRSFPEAATKISIIIDNQRFTAKLDDSAASRDLWAQLPQTVEMSDHGGVEKTGPLHSPLSLDGQPDGADPHAGDLGYYAPGNDLVLYYGDQSYYPGIVILGKLEGDAPRRIAELDGRVSVAVKAG